MTSRYCVCHGGGFVVEVEHSELRCLRCGRRPAPEPCSCRLPARSPRVGQPDFCRSCQRPIPDPATAEEAA